MIISEQVKSGNCFPLFIFAPFARTFVCLVLNNAVVTNLFFIYINKFYWYLVNLQINFLKMESLLMCYFLLLFFMFTIFVFLHRQILFISVFFGYWVILKI